MNLIERFAYMLIRIYGTIYIYLQLDWHPVAVVQYAFTQKQYTEQHNESEYTERNIHNNKNT
jgi:hypothetical protein